MNSAARASGESELNAGLGGIFGDKIWIKENLDVADQTVRGALAITNQTGCRT
jgi:hypothetical protein